MHLSLFTDVHQPIRHLHHDIPNITYCDAVFCAGRIIRDVVRKVPMAEFHIDILQRRTIDRAMPIYFDNVPMRALATQFRHCADFILKALFNFLSCARVADCAECLPCKKPDLSGASRNPKSHVIPVESECQNTYVSGESRYSIFLLRGLLHNHQPRSSVARRRWKK
jgi:hypothetical protein